MISFRSMSLPLLALVAVLAGCSAESSTSPGAESVDGVQQAADTTAASDTSTAGPEGAGRKGPHGQPGGPDFLLQAALHAPIHLSAEQKTTIEGLLASSRPAKPAFDAAGASKLAAAIRSNTLSTLQEPERDETARQAHLQSSAKALATLHDTLTADQRVQLVGDIESHAARGLEGRATGAGPGADKGNKGGERGEGGGFMGRGHGGPGGPGGAVHLLSGLNLSQEQKDAIKTKLEAARPAQPTAEQREQMKAKFEAARADMKAKLETFKGDSFDAVSFVTPPASLARPEVGPGNELAIIASVLTPEQRESLAAQIEKGPTHQAIEKGGARFDRGAAVQGRTLQRGARVQRERGVGNVGNVGNVAK